MKPAGESQLRGAGPDPAPPRPLWVRATLQRAVDGVRRSGLTLTLGALALLAFALPGADAALAYDRSALVAGEGWRVLTGHLVHWSGEHLVWDVATFLVLGSICELRGRRCFALCVATAALAISALLWWGLPGMERYGGLSGLDSALFALLGAGLLADEMRGASWSALALGAALAGAFAFKITFELATAQPLFAGNLGVGVAPAPLAHCAGAAVGLLFAIRAVPRPRPSDARLAEAA